MKRIILLFLFLAPIYFPLFSQDLLVTKEGDSLNCKITGIKKDFIYFTFKYKEEIRNTLLGKDQVVDYKLGYFSKAVVPARYVFNDRSYPHFRVAVNGGYSYRTAPVAKDVSKVVSDYLKQLKSGYHFSADASYYLTELFGLGIKSSVSFSSNSMDHVQVEMDDGTTKTGMMSDDIRIWFIGPAFTIRLLDGLKRNAFLSSVAIGYLDYHDNAVLINKYIIKGNTAGLEVSLGYDFAVSKRFSLGIQVSYLVGSLSQVVIDDGAIKKTVNLPDNAHENLSRLDLTVGIRFNR